MTDLHLDRKRLDGANIQGYSRNGYDLQTQPIPEFLLLYSSLIADGKTAVFVMDSDFIPNVLTAKWTGTTGSITVTIKQSGIVVWTQTYTANEVLLGVNLPQIPMRHDNIEIHVLTAKSLDYLWVSVRQCEVLEVIAPKTTY